MNTRLQVEHPVTELCCGIDLVRAQIMVAQGEPLPWKQEDIERRGHSMEARIYAEDPNQNFMPCPGMIDELVFPNWPGLRVDCGVRSGYEVSRYYDPMIAKVVVWGEDREQASASFATSAHGNCGQRDYNEQQLFCVTYWILNPLFPAITTPEVARWPWNKKHRKVSEIPGYGSCGSRHSNAAA